MNRVRQTSQTQSSRQQRHDPTKECRPEDQLDTEEEPGAQVDRFSLTGRSPASPI